MQRREVSVSNPMAHHARGEAGVAELRRRYHSLLRAGQSLDGAFPVGGRGPWAGGAPLVERAKGAPVPRLLLYKCRAFLRLWHQNGSSSTGFSATVHPGPIPKANWRLSGPFGCANVPRRCNTRRLRDAPGPPRNVAHCARPQGSSRRRPAPPSARSRLRIPRPHPGLRSLDGTSPCHLHPTISGAAGPIHGWKGHRAARASISPPRRPRGPGVLSGPPSRWHFSEGPPGRSTCAGVWAQPAGRG
jgi:hypothetical protein